MAKPNLHPSQPQGYAIEREPIGDGRTVVAATYFLTGSECRFTCSFCDLWKYTLDGPTPPGSLAQQILALHRDVRDSPTQAQWLKLYNAANFFDPYNVPVDDYPSIASACESMERLVVENHARLAASRRGQTLIRAFQSFLAPQLEVAIGLETIDPDAMPLLHKSMALDDFDRACDALSRMRVAIRAFVILQPPGTRSESALDWAVQSCAYAFDRGVERCSIIPARRGNGYMDALERRGIWSPPDASLLESTLRRALDQRDCPDRIVTVDLWDWDSIQGGCDACRNLRYDTMRTMNVEQRPVSREPCPQCESGTDS